MNAAKRKILESDFHSYRNILDAFDIFVYEMQFPFIRNRCRRRDINLMVLKIMKIKRGFKRDFDKLKKEAELEA